MAKGKLQMTDNIMAKAELTKGYFLSFGSFTLAMLLFVIGQFSFGHHIVCLLSVSLWPRYWLSFVIFPMTMILSVFCQLPIDHDIVCLLSFSLWP
jgi:hypothetical protein